MKRVNLSYYVGKIMEKFEISKKWADEKGLYFFITGNLIYIEDGGKRGLSCFFGSSYIDGFEDTYSFDMSSREATDEEVEMWLRLGGPV